MTTYADMTLMGQIEAGGIIPLGGMIVLGGFVPVLSVVAVWIKHRATPIRRKAAVAMYALESNDYYRSDHNLHHVSIVRETLLPLVVIILMSVYFSALLIYTPLALRPPEFMANFLLLGDKYGVERSLLTDRYLLQTVDVMCFAFLGWYVWTVSTIFSRLTTLELVPATYYNILTRLVAALFVAVMFRHLFAIFGTAGTQFVPEAVGFGVGLFPDSALQWLTRQLRRYLLGDTGLTDEFSLDLVQGISPFRKIRLYEIGMDNCENLATANPITLYLTSNLSLLEVIDWIAQAQLLVLVGQDKFRVLQNNSYRTVIDLDRGANSPAAGRLCELLAFSGEQLADVRDGLQKDPNFKRLAGLRDKVDSPKPPATIAPARPIAGVSRHVELQPAV